MRLIDAEKFIQDDYPLNGVLLERSNNTQTIDAVPVVRCLHCKTGKMMVALFFDNKPVVTLSKMLYCPICGRKLEG